MGPPDIDGRRLNPLDEAAPAKSVDIRGIWSGNEGTVQLVMARAGITPSPGPSLAATSR